MSRRVVFRPDPSAAQVEVEVTLIEDDGQSFLLCLVGRMPVERTRRVLPQHAEIIELDDGRVVGFIHLAARNLRPLLDRLQGSPYRVGFSRSPEDWAADLRA
jgi:hypothetical protein